MLTITPWNLIHFKFEFLVRSSLLVRKLVWAGKVEFTTHLLRYGLVVRISGSHPGGPGSIPGNGRHFC